MPRPRKPSPQELLRDAVIGIGRVGARALESGLVATFSSATKDIRKVVDEAQKRLDLFEKGLNGYGRDDDEEDGRDE